MTYMDRQYKIVSSALSELTLPTYTEKSKSCLESGLVTTWLRERLKTSPKTIPRRKPSLIVPYLTWLTIFLFQATNFCIKTKYLQGLILCQFPASVNTPSTSQCNIRTKTTLHPVQLPESVRVQLHGHARGWVLECLVELVRIWSWTAWEGQWAVEGLSMLMSAVMAARPASTPASLFPKHSRHSMRVHVLLCGYCNLQTVN